MRLQRGSGLGGSSPSVQVLEWGMSMHSGLQRRFSNARESSKAVGAACSAPAVGFLLKLVPAV